MKIKTLKEADEYIKVNILGSEIFRDQDHHQRVEVFKKMLIDAESQEEYVLISALFNVLGKLYQEMSYYAKASICFENALDFSPKNEDAEIANCRFNLGSCYQNLGQWNNAARCFNQALRKLPDNKILDCKYNIAICYENSQDWVKAYNAFKEVQLLYDDEGNDNKNLECLSKRMTCLVNKVSSIASMPAIVLSSSASTGGLSLAETLEVEERLGYINLLQVGNDLFDLGKWKEAELVFKNLSIFAGSKQDLAMVAMCDMSIAHCCQNQAQFGEALQYYSKAIEFYESQFDYSSTLLYLQQYELCLRTKIEKSSMQSVASDLISSELVVALPRRNEEQGFVARLNKEHNNKRLRVEERKPDSAALSESVSQPSAFKKYIRPAAASSSLNR